MANYDIFLSHSSKNKNEIDNLVSELHQMGLSIWYDKDIILTGDNILEEIKKGIKNSLCVALYITTDFFESSWTNIEVGFAIDKVKIVPIFVDIPIEDIVKHASFLLSYRYFTFDKNNCSASIKSIAEDVFAYKKKCENSGALNYNSLHNEFNRYNKIGPVTLRTLLSEYERCKEDANYMQYIGMAQEIILTIVNDVHLYFGGEEKEQYLNS